MNLTNSKAWVAITIGVAIVGVAWFAWQGDGNAGGVYSLAEQRSRLEVCPDALEHDAAARACVAELRRRCWPVGAVEVVDECDSPREPDAARLRSCGSSSVCDVGAHSNEEHPGAEVDGDIYVRSAFELSGQAGAVVCHEVLHAVAGLVEHDQHATRIGAEPAGLSWAGMDRCEGGDFDGRIVP